MEVDQLVIDKHDRGVEFTEKQLSLVVRGGTLNPQPPDSTSSDLTTRSRCLLNSNTSLYKKCPKFKVYYLFVCHS